MHIRRVMHGLAMLAVLLQLGVGVAYAQGEIEVTPEEGDPYSTVTITVSGTTFVECYVTYISGSPEFIGELYEGNFLEYTLDSRGEPGDYVTFSCRYDMDSLPLTDTFYITTAAPPLAPPPPNDSDIWITPISGYPGTSVTLYNVSSYYDFQCTVYNAATGTDTPLGTVSIGGSTSYYVPDDTAAPNTLYFNCYDTTTYAWLNPDLFEVLEWPTAIPPSSSTSGQSNNSSQSGAGQPRSSSTSGQGSGSSTSNNERAGQTTGSTSYTDLAITNVYASEVEGRLVFAVEVANWSSRSMSFTVIPDADFQTWRPFRATGRLTANETTLVEFSRELNNAERGEVFTFEVRPSGGARDQLLENNFFNLENPIQPQFFDQFRVGDSFTLTLNLPIFGFCLGALVLFCIVLWTRMNREVERVPNFSYEPAKGNERRDGHEKRTSDKDGGKGGGGEDADNGWGGGPDDPPTQPIREFDPRWHERDPQPPRYPQAELDAHQGRARRKINNALPCQIGHLQVRYEGLEADLAPYQVTHLTVLVRDTASGKHKWTRRLDEQEGVDELNKAYWHLVIHDDLQALHEKMIPIADALMEKLLEWLAQEHDLCNVQIRGTLEGSGAECSFKLYECANRNFKTAWHEIFEWKAKMNHHRGEEIGFLNGFHIREVNKPQLKAYLLERLEQFVQAI